MVDVSPFGILSTAELAYIHDTLYKEREHRERLCEKRPFAFKQSKEKCLYRPKETTFHTASDTNLLSKVQYCTHADARSWAGTRRSPYAARRVWDWHD